MAPSQKDFDDCAQFLKDKFPSSLLGPEEAYFFSPNVYARFSRLHDANHEKAAAAFEACLAWRKSYKPQLIDPETECAALLKTKFLIVGGLDKTGAVVVIITLAHPSYREEGKETRVRLFVWAMEEMLRRGKESFAFLSDFTLVGKEKDPRGTDTRDECTAILDQYYPEMMRLSFMYNPPWFISSFAPLSTAFMSAKLKAKVRTNCKTKDLLKEIDEDQLPAECGGKYEASASIIDGMKRLP